MKHLRLLLLFMLICVSLPSFGEDSYKNKFHWDELEPLPAAAGMERQFGLASPFAGLSNGTVIVTGGCNFPDKSVADGGVKRYYDDIYVLPEGEHKWVTGFKMPYEVGYGASVTTSEGLLCIGGNDNATAFDVVTLLKWNPKSATIEFEQYPSLPVELTQCGAAIIGNVVYVAGGTADGELVNTFLTLDLSAQGDADFGWQVLPPFPGAARLQPVVVSQNAAESVNLYLFGGSSFSKDSSTPDVATAGLVYNSVTKEWSQTTAVIPQGANKPLSLHGAAGMAIGKNHIIFIGGVNLDIFTDALTRERKGKRAKTDDEITVFQAWRKNYFSQAPSWYGFNTKALVYNTITDAWSVGDDYPYPGPAGAAIVPYRTGWMIINGEVKPGERSNKIYVSEIDSTPTFGVLNWGVLILYMLAMLYMGYYFMNKSKSTDDFFKGGGRIPWWAAGMSLFATMLSAITFMAIPAKAFATDWRYFPLAITILIMAFPIIKYYLPFFRRLNVTTAYEYLEKRFNYTIRSLSSCLFIIFMLARMALALFLPALALTTVTGIDIYLCIILMGVITLAYSTMGGVEAVVWSDVVQGFILIGGAIFAVVFLVFNTPGGLPTVIEISIEEDKLRMFDFSFVFTSATFWVIVLGGLANNLISYSSDQTVIQRYISTKSEKAASKSILLNGFLSIFVLIIFYSIGTCLYAFYKTQPENLNYMMQNTDAIFPHFIMAEIPMGFAGLIIAAIFAATMSTVSSNINSLSTAFTVDLYRRVAPGASDAKELSVARWSGIVMGSIGILFALVMASWNILSLFDFFNYMLGLLSSGVAALFVIGIFLPKVGSRSALFGFLLGNTSLVVISVYTNVSFLLYGFIGISLTVIFSLALSLFFKNEKDINGFTWKTIKKQED